MALPGNKVNTISSEQQLPKGHGWDSNTIRIAASRHDISLRLASQHYSLPAAATRSGHHSRCAPQWFAALFHVKHSSDPADPSTKQHGFSPRPFFATGPIASAERCGLAVTMRGSLPTGDSSKRSRFSCRSRICLGVVSAKGGIHVPGCGAARFGSWHPALFVNHSPRSPSGIGVGVPGRHRRP